MTALHEQNVQMTSEWVAELSKYDEDPDLAPESHRALHDRALESYRALHCSVQLLQPGQDPEKYYLAKEEYFAAQLYYTNTTGRIRSRLAERRLRKAVRQMKAVAPR